MKAIGFLYYSFIIEFFFVSVYCLFSMLNRGQQLLSSTTSVLEFYIAWGLLESSKKESTFPRHLYRRLLWRSSVLSVDYTIKRVYVRHYKSIYTILIQPFAMLPCYYNFYTLFLPTGDAHFLLLTGESCNSLFNFIITQEYQSSSKNNTLWNIKTKMNAIFYNIHISYENYLLLIGHWIC